MLMEKIYLIKCNGLQSGFGYKNYVDAFRALAALAKAVEKKGPKGYDNLIHADKKNTWKGKVTKMIYEITWMQVI